MFVGCSSSLSNSNYSISTGRKKIGAVRSINVKHNEANNVCLVLWSHTQIKNKVQTIEDYLVSSNWSAAWSSALNRRRLTHP